MRLEGPREAYTVEEVVAALDMALRRRRIGQRVFGVSRPAVKVWLRRSRDEVAVRSQHGMRVTTFGYTEMEDHPEGGILITCPGGWETF